ncbi:MAG: hemerythrin domain-containing protein [Polyangiaceae bacterium]|nr:hemerythrin domain-containing protein [Polyangiaceae bacterium]
MKATQLLKKQHDEVKELFDKVERAQGKADKRRLFEQLAASLVAHDAIEREIFYPACEEALGLVDILGESLVEHGVIEFCLFRANQNLDTKDFDYYLTVLRETVEHHVDEEEKEFFPKVEKALGMQQLAVLGNDMEQQFEEVVAEDFRQPLVDNLHEVLMGSMRTTPQDERDEGRERPTPKRTAAKKKGTAKHPTNGKTSHVRTHH